MNQLVHDGLSGLVQKSVQKSVETLFETLFETSVKTISGFWLCHEARGAHSTPF